MAIATRVIIPMAFPFHFTNQSFEKRPASIAYMNVLKANNT
jgi:hypothetical protein